MTTIQERRVSVVLARNIHGHAVHIDRLLGVEITGWLLTGMTCRLCAGAGAAAVQLAVKGEGLGLAQTSWLVDSVAKPVAEPPAVSSAPLDICRTGYNSRYFPIRGP